ncbi:MAG: hypothetical protein K0S71_2465 [Clostridia bacterium]|nr:hypothetical protein [Clostridia bacterium]
MKNIRALIKVELKSAALMSLYFLVINIGYLMLTGITISSNFKQYLRYGVRSAVTDFNNTAFLSFVPGLSLFIFLGFILLVYFQFKNDKSLEVGRFLKSLPYTNVQRCLVKMSAGILSYTIPFIILSLGVIMLRAYAMTELKTIYSITPYEGILLTINSIQNLLSLLVLNYLTYTSLYLFVFMMQYLVNHNIGSLIISILTLLAPAFIITSIHYLEIYYGLRYYLERIEEKILLPFYGMITRYGGFTYTVDQSQYYIDYVYIEDIGFKLFITLIISIIGVYLIYQTGKRTKIENADRLMPDAITRIIFITGVTLCAALLLADTYKIFLVPLIGQNIVVLTSAITLIGGTIGFIIARKIAHIGIINKRRD